MPRELLFPLTEKDLEPIESSSIHHSDEIDPPDPWQLEDIEHMYNRMIFTGHGANWSEMGCKKTTTGLWLIQRLHREYWGEDFKPNVFVCTTSAGKGTFFYFAPHILEDWVIINVKATGLSVIVDGKERNLPGINNCSRSVSICLLLFFVIIIHSLDLRSVSLLLMMMVIQLRKK
jgi:hypothetical protein